MQRIRLKGQLLVVLNEPLFEECSLLSLTPCRSERARQFGEHIGSIFMVENQAKEDEHRDYLQIQLKIWKEGTISQLSVDGRIILNQTGF